MQPNPHEKSTEIDKGFIVKNDDDKFVFDRFLAIIIISL